MNLPELDTRGVLRALEPDIEPDMRQSPPWREWVAGLSERRALGYAATLATEFRSTPELRADLTGNEVLTRHLLWIRNRLRAWFEDNQQGWLTYLAASGKVSADEGGPWYWTTTHQRAWNDERPVACPPPVKAMTLFGTSLGELTRSVLVPAARELFTDLASRSPSSREVRKMVALVQFLGNELERSEQQILLDAWSSFEEIRANLKVDPGNAERARECLCELMVCLPDELLIRNEVRLQVLLRDLQKRLVPKRPKADHWDDWTGPWFEEAFLHNWD